MVISIKGMEHLASTIQNQPHKYITYQTQFAVMSKTVHLLFIISGWLSNWKWHAYYMWLSVLDLITTPLVIQLSYIFSNKRNVEIMRKILTFEGICARILKSNQVEPYEQAMDTVG
ncbi:unnamed protein product [Caenorhabditis nigoni]